MICDSSATGLLDGMQLVGASSKNKKRILSICLISFHFSIIPLWIYCHLRQI